MSRFSRAVAGPLSLAFLLLALLLGLLAGAFYSNDTAVLAAGQPASGGGRPAISPALLPAANGSYRLLIVTPEEFGDALQPLVDHKNATDMATYLIKLEDIYSLYPGVDRPEQIKQAIAYYEDSYDVEYVMLVGDANKFPIRWQMGHLFDGNGGFPDTPYHVYVPSDYYYADLYADGAFNDWDEAGSRVGYFGEIYLDDVNPDAIDPHPDVAVGRVPASDISHVETYVAKVINYEYTADDGAWFDNLLLIHREFSDRVHTKEAIASDLSTLGFGVTRLYTDIATIDYPDTPDAPPNPDTILSGLNLGTGFVSHYWHGWWGGWYDMLDVGAMRMGLDNAGMLPIIYTGACDTNKFALTAPFIITYTDVSGVDVAPDTDLITPTATELGIPPQPAMLQSRYNRYSIGEAFLVDSMDGAIAYYGSMETGEWMHLALEEHFFGTYIADRTHGRTTVLGDMWLNAVEQFAAINGLDTLEAGLNEDGDWSWVPMAQMHTPSRHILFGDPSLRVAGVRDLTDDAPPITTDNTDDGWHNEDVLVVLTAMDQATLPSPASGVFATYYQIDGGTRHTGSQFIVPAPADHSNDGIHTLYYYSVDHAGRQEITRTAQVKIDTVAPTVEILLDGDVPATRLCPCALGFSCDCPPMGCYNTRVTVEINAVDDRSGVDLIEYDLDGWPYPVYSGPFDILGGDYLDQITLRYWATDHAGNWNVRSTTFCVSNAEAGRIAEDASILAGLEEIMRMQLRKEFVETLPPIQSVAFAMMPPVIQQWIPLGVDEKGDDGWSFDWNTVQVPNGIYRLRTTVQGFPSKPLASASTLQEPLYEEELTVTVCNVADNAYTFTLEAPVTADRGQTLTYTAVFANQTGAELSNLSLVVRTDLGAFDQVTVLDNGFRDQQGMPAWYRQTLKSGESWKVHFEAKLAQNVSPGAAIHSQALLRSTQLPRLLSDDASTPVAGDSTIVTINLLDGAISGVVQDGLHSVALSDTVVTLEGPVMRKTTTGADGAYAFAGLPPGVYQIGAVATGYRYLKPEGPVARDLDGSGRAQRADFYLVFEDTRAPVSHIRTDIDGVVGYAVKAATDVALRDRAGAIQGVAWDPEPGLGVDRVELSIYCNTTGLYWNGNDWGEAEVWLPAAGTGAWSVDTSAVTWQLEQIYTVRSRAVDAAGNVEMPIAITTAPPAPILSGPANGAVIAGKRPTFVWSAVPGCHYVLEVDDQADFMTPEIHQPDTLSATTFRPSFDLDDGVYHWRVLAVSEGGPSSAWSETWTVTIEPAAQTGESLFLPFIEVIAAKDDK